MLFDLFGERQNNLQSGPGGHALPGVRPRQVHHRLHHLPQRGRVPVPHLHLPGQVIALEVID